MSGPNAEGLPLRRLDYREPVTETQPEVPEQVYLDAAKAGDAALFPTRPPLPESTARYAQHTGFRAAVESAYRAGYQAGAGGTVTP